MDWDAIGSAVLGFAGGSLSLLAKGVLDSYFPHYFSGVFKRAAEKGRLRTDTVTALQGLRRRLETLFKYQDLVVEEGWLAEPDADNAQLIPKDDYYYLVFCYDIGRLIVQVVRMNQGRSNGVGRDDAQFQKFRKLVDLCYHCLTRPDVIRGEAKPNRRNYWIYSKFLNCIHDQFLEPGRDGVPEVMSFSRFIERYTSPEERVFRGWIKMVGDFVVDIHPTEHAERWQRLQILWLYVCAAIEAAGDDALVPEDVRSFTSHQVRERAIRVGADSKVMLVLPA